MKRLALIAALALISIPAAAQRVSGNDDPARLVALGERLERQGELTGAMVFYDRALQFDPAYPLALRAAAANAMARGAAAEAARYYSTWANAEPRNPDALIGLAGTLIAQQKPDEALALLQRAEDLNGNRGRIAAQRGIAFDLQGNTGSAQAAYAAALNANTGDAVTTQRMALSLALGRQDGAALTLMKRFGNEPESAEVRRTLALIHALGGRQADAAEIAASLYPLAEAQKMRAFYAQLPRLAPRDRAVAVHFGLLPGGAPVAVAANSTPVPTPSPVPAIPTGPAQSTITTTPVAPPPPSRVTTTPVTAAAPVAPQPIAANLLASRPRIWVQISSLGDASRLPLEWRRVRGAAGDALAGQLPYVQRTATTNRLLVGPYATEAAARQALAQLKARRVDGLINRTPAGANLVPLAP